MLNLKRANPLGIPHSWCFDPDLLYSFCMKTQGRIPTILVGISLAAANMACRISKAPLIGDLDVVYRHNGTETSLSWYRRDPNGRLSNESLSLLKYPTEFYISRGGSNSEGGYQQEIASTTQGVSVLAIDTNDKNGAWLSAREDANGVMKIELDMNHFRRK